MNSLYLAGALLLAMLIGAGLWGWHEHSAGFDAGVAKGTLIANKAEANQRQAEANQTTCALALRQVNADAADARGLAHDQAVRADAAVARAAAFEAQGAADSLTFAKALKAATALPSCSGLKEKICAAVPFPY